MSPDFLLLHSNCMSRMWRNKHRSMDPVCFVSTVQRGRGCLAFKENGKKKGKKTIELKFFVDETGHRGMVNLVQADRTVKVNK